MKKQKSAIEKLKERKDVEFTTVSMPANTMAGQHSKDLIKRAGLTVIPTITDQYLGSAVVHYYATKEDDLHCVSQLVGMDTVHEIQAGIGMDELRNKLMSFFGRHVRGKNKK